MYHDTVPDKQIIVHGDDIMWSMTYSKTQSWRETYVVNVPRHSLRQVNKVISVRVNNIKRFMTYSKEKYGDKVLW